MRNVSLYIEYENLLSKKPFWNDILYDRKLAKIDVYFNSIGHPKHIHDEYGAEGVYEFRTNLVNEIKKEISVMMFGRFHQMVLP